jgi:uncharacterized protein with HEPN domain
MPRDDVARLRHMIEAGEAACRFATGRRRGDLDSDLMLQFALVRAVEIIGEAASKLSTEARSAAPTVPWTQIVAMRNRLIHAYFDIDRDILWRTVSEEIPQLLVQLRTLGIDE